MELYLIRHTTTKGMSTICYGQTNVPLAKTFRKEAKTVIRTLPKDIDIIFTSPLHRCTQLAKNILAKKIVRDNRLLEMNFGDWEMASWDDIHKETLDVWMKHFVTMRVPDGESFMDLYKRVNNFTKALSKKEYNKVAIVTHAGVIRCLIAMALQIPLTDIFDIPVAYASVNRLILKDDGSLDKLL